MKMSLTSNLTASALTATITMIPSIFYVNVDRTCRQLAAKNRTAVRVMMPPPQHASQAERLTTGIAT